MVWTQHYDPLHDVLLSTLIAALPVVLVQSAQVTLVAVPRELVPVHANALGS